MLGLELKFSAVSRYSLKWQQPASPGVDQLDRRLGLQCFASYLTVPAAIFVEFYSPHLHWRMYSPGRLLNDRYSSDLMLSISNRTNEIFSAEQRITTAPREKGVPQPSCCVVEWRFRRGRVDGFAAHPGRPHPVELSWAVRVVARNNIRHIASPRRTTRKHSTVQLCGSSPFTSVLYNNDVLARFAGRVNHLCLRAENGYTISG